MGNRKGKLLALLYIVVRLSMVVSAGVGIWQGKDQTVLLSAAALVVLMLPTLIEKKKFVSIPGGLEAIMVIFIFASIFLGEMQDFYTRIPNWDMYLHTLSGVIIALIGLSLVSILNESERVALSLSPLFLALFAFCFAVTAGVVWEFYEYLMDTFLGYNMQKPTLLANGMYDTGLIDTMEDLMVDALGALGVSVYGYIQAKTGNWAKVRRLLIRRRHAQDEEKREQDEKKRETAFAGSKKEKR